MFIEFVTLALVLNVVESKMEPKVVKGDLGDISTYAHSVFLQIDVADGGYVCGSSVINQNILLTAAHCVEICVDGKCLEAKAHAGNANKRQGQKFPIAGYIMHENYDRRRVHNDIGLVLLRKSLKLGELVKRIIITKKPSLAKVGTIAGWGLVNEVQNIHTDYLHSAQLKLLSFEECRKIISSIPKGCLCAGQIDSEAYASEGDSGSALVVDKYIEIGLVSYKRPDISRSIVVFTDVSYFYDWIKLNAKRLYCKTH